MASNKLTWQELRKAVAEYAHCSEQEADGFLNALLEGVVEGLKNDKQVKIKGLGVFSLKPVAPRKSVNIATGEDFTIEGYNKLTFSAESMLKESVEKRIEKPATKEAINDIVSDPMKKLGEQANEIVDLLSDLGQTPDNKEVTKKGKKTIKKTPTVEVVEDPKATNKQEKIPAIIPPTMTKKKCTCRWIYGVTVICALLLATAIGISVHFKEQITGWWQCTKIMEKPITRSQYHDIITSKHTPRAAIEKPNADDARLDKAIKMVSGWMENAKFWNHETEEEAIKTMVENADESVTPVREVQSPNASFEELNYNRAPGIQALQPIRREVVIEDIPEEFITETVVAEEITTEMPLNEEEIVEEVIEQAAQVVTEKPITIPLANQPREYTKFIGTELVSKDSRLTWIAYKYYGNKDLWVFIYEANRDVITHPAHVTPGQKLRIPKLENKYLDLGNPELRQLVDQLTAEYLK